MGRCQEVACLTPLAFSAPAGSLLQALTPKTQHEVVSPALALLHCRSNEQLVLDLSSTGFDAQPPDLPPVSLLDMGFAIHCSLAR